MSTVLERIRWQSVAALFSKDPKNTPFNNGSNFNTNTSMIHTLTLPDELE